jgi:hypothetical protein
MQTHYFGSFPPPLEPLPSRIVMRLDSHNLLFSRLSWTVFYFATHFFRTYAGFLPHFALTLEGSSGAFGLRGPIGDHQDVTGR